MPFAPSVQQHDVPRDAMDLDELEKIAAENASPDERVPQTVKDKIRERDIDNLDAAEGGEKSGDRHVDSATPNGAAVTNGASRKRLLPEGFTESAEEELQGRPQNGTAATTTTTMTGSGQSVAEPMDVTPSAAGTGNLSPKTVAAPQNENQVA